MPPHLEIIARQCRAFRQEILRRKISLRDYLFSAIAPVLVQAQTETLALKMHLRAIFLRKNLQMRIFFRNFVVEI